MPNVDLTEMDLAVVACLNRLAKAEDTAVTPVDLASCLEELFPDSDEVAMREGESITRLRGRQFVDLDTDGRIRLTSTGEQLALELTANRD